MIQGSVREGLNGLSPPLFIAWSGVLGVNLFVSSSRACWTPGTVGAVGRCYWSWSDGSVIPIKVCTRTSGRKGEYPKVRLWVDGECVARSDTSVVRWLGKI